MTLPNLDRFKQKFSGEVILPADSTYAQFKDTLFFKGSPALILKPKTAQDISEAISFAKQNKLVVSVRSGGHSASGFSTNTDGVVIEMSAFNTIELIDKEKHIVKVGTGARWIDAAKKLHEYGLALSSGDTKSVGVGGLTLGGGIGWMVRKHGLTIDSLVAAEVVTADDQVLRASETENSDLLWAIRGGGGNFGVVTYFEFVAYPTGKVYSGTLTYALENLGEMLKGWRNLMRTANENLTSILNVLPSFAEGMPPSIMITCCYAKDNEQKAMAAVEPFTKLGKMLKNDFKQKEYFEVLEDAYPPPNIKIITKNVFAKEFNDEMIQAIVDAQSKVKMFILQIRSLGGAVKRVATDKTAFTFRDSEVMVLNPIFVPPTSTDAEIVAALQPWETIAKFGEGSYVNFLSEPDEDLAAVYSKETYQKLVEVKKKYDPANIFSQNYNIR